MKPENYAIYDFPCGKLKIGYTDTAIRYVLFTDEQGSGLPSKLSELAALQLGEYFDGKRKSFDLPLEVLNALFQARVLFDEQLGLRRLLAVPLNQEGDLNGLLSVQLEQCLASRLLCHTMSLPNPPPVCYPLHSR